MAWLSTRRIQAQARVLVPQLQRSVTPGSPFVALIDNHASGAALLAAAERGENNVVLLPHGLAHLAGDVACRTGASACVQIGADGLIEVLAPDAPSSAAIERRRAEWHTHPATAGGGGACPAPAAAGAAPRLPRLVRPPPPTSTERRPPRPPASVGETSSASSQQPADFCSLETDLGTYIPRHARSPPGRGAVI